MWVGLWMDNSHFNAVILLPLRERSQFLRLERKPSRWKNDMFTSDFQFVLMPFIIASTEKVGQCQCWKKSVVFQNCTPPKHFTPPPSWVGFNNLCPSWDRFSFIFFYLISRLFFLSCCLYYFTLFKILKFSCLCLQMKLLAFLLFEIWYTCRWPS